MNVPFLDVRAGTEELADELREAIDRVVHSGRYVLGAEVEAFEEEFAAYAGAQHCVGVGTGLDALAFALESSGLGAGDEALVPSNTYIATWLAVSRVGAVPVPVEPDPGTANLDPARLEDAVGSNTRAVVAAHLYGQPADMDAIAKVAEANDLVVVEDAAQAHGAAIRGVRVGGLGTTAAWSFYPSKNLGALGDAGAVTTDDADVAARVRLLRNYGASSKYVNDVQGANSRLDELQAAVLRVKLRHLDRWNGRRREVAERYLAELAGIEGLALPDVPPWAEPAWHVFVVRHEERDRLASRLSEAGVQTLVHYPIPPHRQAAYAELGLAEGSLPLAEQLARTSLSLPMGPHLSDDQQRYVVERVRAAVHE